MNLMVHTKAYLDVQHDKTNFFILRFMVWCDEIRCDALQCDMIWHGMTWVLIWYKIRCGVRCDVWHYIWYKIPIWTHNLRIHAEWSNHLNHWNQARSGDLLWNIIWYIALYNIMIDMTWYMIWYDMTWHDTTRHDTTRPDIWYDMVWYGMIWYDMIYDMIWYKIW